MMAVVMALLLVPSSALAQSTVHAACNPIDLAQGGPDDASCQDVPSFKASFLNRVWKFDGNVDAVDLSTHSLDMTLTGIENLPKRFANQDDALLDQDTQAQFKDGTRVYGPDGKLVTQDYLPYAESVVVRGKLVAPRRWSVDDSGNAVPTVRAKRIYIEQYVEDASSVNDGSGDASDPAQADPQADPATDPSADPSADQPSDQSGDPTPGDGVITSHDVEIWIHIHVHVAKRA
jgi:hypothetical protein